MGSKEGVDGSSSVDRRYSIGYDGWDCHHMIEVTTSLGLQNTNMYICTVKDQYLENTNMYICTTYITIHQSRISIGWGENTYSWSNSVV